MLIASYIAVASLLSGSVCAMIGGSVVDEYSIVRNFGIGAVLLILAVWVLTSVFYLHKYHKQMNLDWNDKINNGFKGGRDGRPRSTRK